MAAATEPIWEAKGEHKRAAVRRMFAEVAPSYDRLNAWMSLGLCGRWRAHAVRLLNLQPGNTALDVCAGTGDFLPALRRAVGAQGTVAAVDFCAPMLHQARPKGFDGLALGDACALPIATESVDAVTVGWGIRNVPDIDLAHAEIARVLRPGGRFVSLDMAVPSHPLVRAVSRWIFHTVIPRLGSRFGKLQAYTYLPQSTERFWSRERLAASMERAGFQNVRTKDLFFGNLCIHYGQRPSITP